MTFAETLELVMGAKGLKAVEVAERSGVAASYLSKLATGRVKEPTWQKACAIIDALGMTTDEFKHLQEGTVMKE